MDTNQDLPIVVIGGGPVGLAAAAHLAERSLPAVVLEAGPRVGAAVLDWGHVRLFSPWRYVVDASARRQLEDEGWTSPDPERLPTGRELVEDYLEPLAKLPGIAPMLRTGARVTAVARLGADKLKDGDRAGQPFEVRFRTDTGDERLLARAVIDASGTWASPNPVGANGLPADGETAQADRIAYGIPDVLGADRERYADAVVAVVGSGHSAQNVVRDLATLKAEHPDTAILWLVRRPEAGQMFGGGDDDQLPARGRLGVQAQELIDAGVVEFVAGFRVDRVERDGGTRLALVAEDGRRVGPVDRIVAATGFRPDLEPLHEVRTDLDPVVESTRALAPLIDPNLHSCGSVPPHGYRELQHDEPGLYVTGAKSYGRAPTFLLATGYEQVRSVIAALDGDLEEAEAVRLDLPATGVCRSDAAAEESGAAAACCGSSAPAATPEPVAAVAGGCCG